MEARDVFELQMEQEEGRSYPPSRPQPRGDTRRAVPGSPLFQLRDPGPSLGSSAGRAPRASIPEDIAALRSILGLSVDAHVVEHVYHACNESREAALELLLDMAATTHSQPSSSAATADSVYGKSVATPTW